jgi:polyphosphate kinase
MHPRNQKVTSSPKTCQFLQFQTIRLRSDNRLAYAVPLLSTVRAPDHPKGHWGDWSACASEGLPTAKEKNNNGEKRLKRKRYEKELRRLQAELCKLQDWVKYKGLRIMVVFEGRDAAGKGGTIRAITERVSPRIFRLVALPAPADREKSQMYMQRYMTHFPAAGEIVIWDRSWYNRAGVEHVMGFCSKEQYKTFLKLCPTVEKYVVDAGIILLKYWLEVGKKEQQRRFEARIKDPLRQWKLSPMDLESFRRWNEYSRARDRMLEATDGKHAPWHIVRSDDKKRARLNCIAHLLSMIPYGRVPHQKVKLPKRSTKGRYDDEASMKGRHFIPEKY